MWAIASGKTSAGAQDDLFNECLLKFATSELTRGTIHGQLGPTPLGFSIQMREGVNTAHRNSAEGTITRGPRFLLG